MKLFSETTTGNKKSVALKKVQSSDIELDHFKFKILDLETDQAKKGKAVQLTEVTLCYLAYAV